MTDKKLREVLQKLTDACVVAGNLIPWPVYSAAREALAEPTEVVLPKGLEDVLKRIIMNGWDRPLGERLMDDLAAEIPNSMMKTKPEPTVSDSEVGQLKDALYNIAHLSRVCTVDDARREARTALALGETLKSMTVAEFAATSVSRRVVFCVKCNRGCESLGVGGYCALCQTDLRALLTDMLRCLEPISRNGRLSEGGEQRGNRGDVEDCMVKIHAALKGVW